MSISYIAPRSFHIERYRESRALAVFSALMVVVMFFFIIFMNTYMSMWWFTNLSAICLMFVSLELLATSLSRMRYHLFASMRD